MSDVNLNLVSLEALFDEIGERVDAYVIAYYIDSGSEGEPNKYRDSFRMKGNPYLCKGLASSMNKFTTAHLEKIQEEDKELDDL